MSPPHGSPRHSTAPAPRWLGAVLALLVLGGCAVPRAGVDSTGRLEVLRSDGRFPTPALTGDWIAYGDSGRFTPAIRDGVPAVHAVGGTDTSILARRVDSMMLATPYLSWAWSMDPPSAPENPVAIVVGLYGGDPASGSWGSRPLAWTGSPLPPFDRILTFRWGAAALQRGTLDDATGPRRRAYVVRGGDENTRTWWLETVDLSAIYARAWPKDDFGRAKVMFVGIRAAETDPPDGGPAPGGYVSGIILSR